MVTAVVATDQSRTTVALQLTDKTIELLTGRKNEWEAKKVVKSVNINQESNG